MYPTDENLASGETYKEKYRHFNWKMPEVSNPGIDVCAKRTTDKNQAPLICEDSNGRTRKFIFHTLKDYTKIKIRSENVLTVNF